MIDRQTLEGKLSYIKTSLETIRGLQTVDYGSVRSRRTISGNSSDWSVVTTAGQVKNYLMTIASVSGENALIDFTYWFRYNNSAVLADPVVGVSVGLPVEVFFLQKAPTLGEQQWLITLRHDPGEAASFTTYFKFMFDGTDDVTWDIQAI